MVKQSILLKAKLNKGMQQSIELTGRCMDPLLLEGDKVKIKAATQYRLGELCLFEMYDGNFAVHRLVSKKGLTAILKGDRTRKCEEVPYEAIIGIADSVQLKGSLQWNVLPTNIFYRIYIALISRGNIFDKQLSKKTNFIQKMCLRLVMCHGRYWRSRWR